MISKQRLEELIEQGATIYSTDTKFYGLVKWLELENKLDNLEFNRDGEVKLFITDNGWWHWFNLNDLYEELEDIMWIKEFGNIERTIKLDLPKWEDIEKDKNFHYIRHYVITKNFSFFIEIYKFTNQISISWSGGCKKTDPRFDENWELTKENYTLACRQAKELFLGG